MANVVKYILEINSKDAQQGLKKAGKETKDLSKDMKKAERSGLDMASKVGSAVTGLAAGIGLIKGAFSTLTNVIEDTARASFELSRSVVDSVNELNDLNAVSALSAQSIQAITQAFVGSGQSASSAASFIARFPKVLADLEVGAARATEAAEQLGVSVRDSSGNMKSADVILKEMIGRLQAVENDTKRTTIAFTLFGRGAGQLLQAFGKTAEFEKFLEFTEKFGVKTGPEASASAARFQEILSALEITTGRAKQAFVEAIGGIGFFNNLMFKGVTLLVAFTTAMENNKDEVSDFANALVNLGSETFGFFQFMLMKFNNIVAEAVAFLTMKLLTPAFALNKLGLMSDETFQKMEQLGMKTNEAGLALENVVAGVNDSITKNTDKAEEAGNILESILSGIDKESDDFKDQLEELAKSMDTANQASADLTAQNNQISGSAKRLNFAMDFVLKTMDTFDETPQAVRDAQENVRRLENSLKAFAEAGFLEDDFFNVTAREQLIEAQKRLDQAIQDTTETVEKSASSLEKFSSKFTNFISKISDPSSLLAGIVAGKFATKLGDLITKDLLPAFLKSDARSKLGGAGTVIGKGIQGLGGAVGAVAPVIGPLVAVVGALEKLGQSTPKDLRKQFDDFVKNFKRGAKILPILLADILPRFIAQMVVAIVEAGINLAFQLPRAIRDGLFDFVIFLGKELKKSLFGWFERVSNFFSNFGEFFNNIFTREGRRENRQKVLGFESGGRFVPSTGLRFTGADDGLAMLHRGETVVPESNRRSQAVDRTMNSMTGGGVTVVVNAEIVESNAIDELVRRIEQRFQDFGGARSTLFGV